MSSNSSAIKEREREREREMRYGKRISTKETSEW
jgi:hypothetical protein